MPVEEHMPGMERMKDEQSLPELSSQLVTILTTEHYNLQTGRSMTVADANGRCTLFIGAVSGALIAIAFTGQVSRMGTAFFVFSLVLLPSLLLMGLITFERVLQSAIEDLTYERGSHHLPGELGHSSTLSMGAMEAPGAGPGGPH
jgi:hypothetical protein